MWKMKGHPLDRRNLIHSVRLYKMFGSKDKVGWEDNSMVFGSETKGAESSHFGNIRTICGANLSPRNKRTNSSHLGQAWARRRIGALVVVDVREGKWAWRREKSQDRPQFVGEELATGEEARHSPWHLWWRLISDAFWLNMSLMNGHQSHVFTRQWSFHIRDVI